MASVPPWLPNAISMFRIALIPVVIVLIWIGDDGSQGINGWRFLGLTVFVVAGISDALDGYVARKYGLVSDLGKLLDPLADKLLVICVLVQLVAQGQVWAWVACLFIFREFFITGLRALAADAGIILAAQKVGKWKTTTQIVAIGFLILAPLVVDLGGLDVDMWLVGTFLLLVALVLALWSGFDYTWQLRGLLRNPTSPSESE